jgi:hypothetical protein
MRYFVVDAGKQTGLMPINVEQGTYRSGGVLRRVPPAG